MSNLRTKDRVRERGTGRTGTVTNVTSSPGWVDQARVEWDDGPQPDGLLDWPACDALDRIC